MPEQVPMHFNTQSDFLTNNHNNSMTNNHDNSMTFHDDFVWGAATASYQIEGAHRADGKGDTVWDRMAHWKGRIYQGHTGDVACDHYHLWEKDVDIMAEMGLQGYRLSLSWARILPEGKGAINAKGLDFYSRLVDKLLERNIAPWVTLFHWDYPLALYQQGGWLAADSPKWFADYARIVAEKLGDRVGHWITLNEPQIFIYHGHREGSHAPGLVLPTSDLARIAHHVLMAHGMGVQVLRNHCKKTPIIGWAPAVGVRAVEEGFEKDAEVVSAAYEAQFALPDIDSFPIESAVWSDAALLGRYPEKFVEECAQYLPKGWENELPIIAQPLDFCGLNIYWATTFHYRNDEGVVACRHEQELQEGYPRTLFGWPVTPSALYWGPRFYYERYNIPIVITENGMSAHDWVSLDGKVHDPQRIDFTTRYLRELHRATQDGTDVRGYFHWSFMDNFEWGQGYKERFGLVHVDFKTLTRTPKDSAYWYRDVIASNGANIL